MAFGAAAAPVAPSVLHDIDGLPPYREHIVEGVHTWLQSAELARRSMLLMRCGALDRSFPARPSPKMVAVFNAANDWTLKGGRDGEPANGLLRASREMGQALLELAVEPSELASWDQFRATPQGQRALALMSLRAAFSVMSNALVDVSTGTSWSWPIYRLRRLADELGLRSELDAAFEDLFTGGAAFLASAAQVPGEEIAGRAVLDSLAGSMDTLDAKFLARLSPADEAALDALEKQKLYARWPDLSRQVLHFASLVPPGLELHMIKPGSSLVSPTPLAEEFCRKAGLAPCMPGTPLNNALTRFQGQFDYWVHGRDLNAMKAQVRTMKAAECP